MNVTRSASPLSITVPAGVLAWAIPGMASVLTPGGAGNYPGTTTPMRAVPADALIRVTRDANGFRAEDGQGGWIADRFAPISVGQGAYMPARYFTTIARRVVPEAEVVGLTGALYATGKHAGFVTAEQAAKHARDQYAGRAAEWVHAEVPHLFYSADWNADFSDGIGADPREVVGAERFARAAGYAMRGGVVPPGIGLFNARGLSRGAFVRPRIYVPDGNHRALAAWIAMRPTAAFFVPLPEWERFAAILAAWRS